MMATVPAGAVQATFAAGCFWGTQHHFRKKFGAALINSGVGYMGGATTCPHYKEVCTGTTNHAEVLHVHYDPEQVSYEQLLLFFFQMHNSSTKDRQGNDTGTQYRSSIFYHSDEQKELANEFINGKLNSEDDPIGEKFRTAFGADAKCVTNVVPAGTYYDGEDYHQEYLEKNPGGYCNHRIYWKMDG